MRVLRSRQHSAGVVQAVLERSPATAQTVAYVWASNRPGVVHSTAHEPTERPEAENSRTLMGTCTPPCLPSPLSPSPSLSPHQCVTVTLSHTGESPQSSAASHRSASCESPQCNSHVAGTSSV